MRHNIQLKYTCKVQNKCDCDLKTELKTDAANTEVVVGANINAGLGLKFEITNSGSEPAYGTELTFYGKGLPTHPVPTISGKSCRLNYGSGSGESSVCTRPITIF